MIKKAWERIKTNCYKLENLPSKYKIWGNTKSAAYLRS